jgi:hypothetical protein
VLGGALGGAALAATFPWQALLLGAAGESPSAATIVAGAVLGAVGGLVGERLGGALRLLVPARMAEVV